MGNAKKKSQQAASNWSGYLAKVVEAYLMFIMVVFVLYCKEGYVAYDLNKRNLFYIGSSIFIVISVVLWMLSLAESKDEAWKKLFSKMDLWLVVLLATWVVGVFTCGDRASAIGGDVYRYVGFAYLGLGIVGMWIISRYAQWTVWLSRVFAAVGCIIFIWQIMNCYYIDPLNWTFDGQYHHLMSSLANLNQNACFDAMFLAVGMTMFLFAKKREDQIGFGIFILLGYMGGIACISSTFFMGLAAVYVGMLFYVLRHPQYLWKFWMEVVMFVVAIVLHKMIYVAVADDRIVLESLTAILFDVRVILALVAILAVGALLIWKAGKFFEKTGVVLSWIFLGLIGAVIVLFIACVVYANTGHVNPEDGGLLSHLVINDWTGNARGVIWRVTFGMFGQESLFQKLFGVGLNNYSTEVYKYYAADVNAIFGEASVLADAHNVFLDMLISSGIIGAVSFMGISVHILVKAIKMAKKQPVLLTAILGILAWMAVGLLNANLNVATQVYFGMLGVFWALIRKLETCEETKDIIGLV